MKIVGLTMLRWLHRLLRLSWLLRLLLSLRLLPLWDLGPLLFSSKVDFHLFKVLPTAIVLEVQLFSKGCIYWRANDMISIEFHFEAMEVLFDTLDLSHSWSLHLSRWLLVLSLRCRPPLLLWHLVWSTLRCMNWAQWHGSLVVLACNMVMHLYFLFKIIISIQN